MKTNEMHMLDQNLHKNLLYNTSVLLPMIEQNICSRYRSRSTSRDNSYNRTNHKIDTVLHLETDLVMTKVLLLHTTLDHDMIRTNVIPGLTVLHTDPSTDLLIDTTLALDTDHAPIPEITNLQNVQFHIDHLQDQETLDFLNLVHIPTPETKLIWYNNKTNLTL